MGREKEKFWEYVEDLNGRFLCRFCRRKFSGGITRIKSHLSGLKCRDIEICTEVPQDVQLAALEAIDAPNKRERAFRALDHVGESENTVTEVCNINKSDMDRIVAKFAVSNDTFHLSDMPFLIDLLKGIAEFGPTYELPNYTTLGSELIPEIHKEAVEYVESVKQLTPTTGCSLVINNVTERSKLVCMKTVAYTPGGVVYVNKIVVPEEGLLFCDFINSIYSGIESVGPQNVVHCIMNHTYDHILDSIVDIPDESFFMLVHAAIQRKYPWIHLLRCASYEVTVLLILTYIAVPWIHKTTQLAKLIFRYMYKNNRNVLLLREEQGEGSSNKEYNCGLTKIAIEFYTLTSILEIEKDWQGLQLPTIGNDVAEVVYIAIKSAEFWSRCRKVVRVLQPLFQVLELIEVDGSTSGYLYEAMKRAEEAIEQPCDANDFAHFKMIRIIFKKWRSRVVHPLHAAAALLNPAYFCSKNFIEDSDMHNGLLMLTSFLSGEEQEAFWTQLQLYRMKDSNLFTDSSIKILKTMHPRKWWECCGDHCPTLQKYVVWLLSQTCATPSCMKSNFIPIDTTDEMRTNVIMMEHYRTAIQNLELIDLDRYRGLPKYDPEYINKYLERQYGLDCCDLLVINNPDERIISILESNADNILVELKDQNGWISVP